MQISANLSDLLVLREHRKYLIETLIRLFQPFPRFVTHFLHTVPQLLDVIVEIDTTHIFVADPLIRSRSWSLPALNGAAFHNHKIAIDSFSE